MRKLLWLLIPVLALIGWLFARNSTPPEVPFTKAARETLVSTLSTNGKVEPVASAAIRSVGSGAVETIHVERGQAVVQGQLLVTLNSTQAQTELSSAQSKIAQAKAELE